MIVALRICATPQISSDVETHEVQLGGMGYPDEKEYHMLGRSTDPSEIRLDP